MTNQQASVFILTYFGAPMVHIFVSWAKLFYPIKRGSSFNIQELNFIYFCCNFRCFHYIAQVTDDPSSATHGYVCQLWGCTSHYNFPFQQLQVAKPCVKLLLCKNLGLLTRVTLTQCFGSQLVTTSHFHTMIPHLIISYKRPAFLFKLIRSQTRIMICSLQYHTKKNFRTGNLGQINMS